MTVVHRFGWIIPLSFCACADSGDEPPPADSCEGWAEVVIEDCCAVNPSLTLCNPEELEGLSENSSRVQEYEAFRPGFIDFCMDVADGCSGETTVSCTGGLVNGGPCGYECTTPCDR